jgi:hypothetical protein
MLDKISREIIPQRISGERSTFPATAVRGSAFLALPLGLHVGKRGVSTLLQGQLDAFHEQIMDFASLVEGDLPQPLIGGLWQIDARMLDVRDGGQRPAGFAGALSLPVEDRRRFAIKWEVHRRVCRGVARCCP